MREVSVLSSSSRKIAHIPKWQQLSLLGALILASSCLFLPKLQVSYIKATWYYWSSASLILCMQMQPFKMMLSLLCNLKSHFFSSKHTPKKAHVLHSFLISSSSGLKPVLHSFHRMFRQLPSLHPGPRDVSFRPMISWSGLRRCITQPHCAAELEFHLEGAASAEDAAHLKLTDTARIFSSNAPNMFSPSPSNNFVHIHNPECLDSIQLHHVPSEKNKTKTQF